MMLESFKTSPWRTSHEHYKNSALAISPAPEYASSEVLVASLYRTIGFNGVGEGGVPQAGRDLDKLVQGMRNKRKPRPADSSIEADTWHTVLHGILESPKLPNQSTKRFLQITPLVPHSAIFSGSARLSSNSWPAGSLVRRMICLGSKDQASAIALWEELFHALSVEEEDDVFARWLEQETSAWIGSQKWSHKEIPADDMPALSSADFQSLQFLPARQFAKDLRAVIRAKGALTRRQWTGLLEAVLRLACVSHIAWLCDVHIRMSRCLSEALSMKGPTNVVDAREAVFPTSPNYMTYGGKALQGLKDKTSGYLAARLNINALLWSLDDAGVGFGGEISSSEGILSLCQHVRTHQSMLAARGIGQQLSEIQEREARALNCKKGIGANVLEFARHTLGQRQTASPLLRGYDQSYVLKKKGTSNSSPWVVSLGPVAVLAFVHCALAGMVGPRSIHRLGQHLAQYGIAVDRHDIATNDLGHQLRMLGLVLDSPDAESGMLLLPPFPSSQASSTHS